MAWHMGHPLNQTLFTSLYIDSLLSVPPRKSPPKSLRDVQFRNSRPRLAHPHLPSGERGYGPVVTPASSKAKTSSVTINEEFDQKPMGHKLDFDPTNTSKDSKIMVHHALHAYCVSLIKCCDFVHKKIGAEHFYEVISFTVAVPNKYVIIH
jgi:N-alpha-acetyltransferase 35, NatC auxiliary subunit